MKTTLLAFAALVASSLTGNATGSWTQLANNAPAGIQMLLLLPDGTVMAQGYFSTSWYRLTPDANGSYINGTWSNRASMNESRLFYSSVVLQNGKVFVAGGEYGTNGTTNAAGTNMPPFNEYLQDGEIYDPIADTWTRLPAVPSTWANMGNSPFGQFAFGDSSASLIANGNVLIAPVFPNNSSCVIYDVPSNSWIEGPQYVGSLNQNEATWLKLPDDSILTVPTNSMTSQRYVPANNAWENAGNVPVNLYSAFGSETGAALLLPDGRGFFIGGSNKTAIYRPNEPLATRWIAGPDMPDDPSGNDQGAPDAAAAMMRNGRILLALSRVPYQPAGGGPPVVFPIPTRFYEFDPIDSTYTAINGPTGASENHECYKVIMLALPDGRILYSNNGQTLYVYTPDGIPVVGQSPTIQSITPNAGDSWHLTGTKLTGFSTGAAYGDDAQMDTNFPLVRLTDGLGHVHYARTFDWSSNSVQTGDAVLSTEFTLPSSLFGTVPGNYSLVVVVNGLASNPVTFTTPSWVHFAYPGLPLLQENGSFYEPFNTFEEGTTNVASGSVLWIKAGTTNATVTNLGKPMTIRAYGGPVTIGQ